MKAILSYAIKELKTQRLTSILIIIAVILSTMMTTTIGQSIGVLDAMRLQQATYLNGNRHITFHNVSKETIEQLSADKSLEYVGGISDVGTYAPPNNALSIFLKEYQDNDISAWANAYNLLDGRLPANANEIVLPLNTLPLISSTLKLNDSFTIPMNMKVPNSSDHYDFDAEFKLVGISEENHFAYSTGRIFAIAGEGTSDNLLPEKYKRHSVEIRFNELYDFQSQVDRLAMEYNIHEDDIQYNWILLKTFGVPYDGDVGTSGFNLMAISGVLVGVLVLLAAGLVIYNILKISVCKKIKEFGTLRALGAEKSNIYSLVLFQVFILCIIGIPIGMVFGYFSAESILTTITGSLNTDLFAVNSASELSDLIAENSVPAIIPLFISGLISLGFALLASIPSAKYASNISPTMAMNDVSVKIKRSKKTMKKIKNFYRFYAKLNLKRNKSRTVITIISLVMSITVFLGLETFTKALDVSNAVQTDFDYSISNNMMGLTEDSLHTLQQNDMIDKVFTQSNLSYDSSIFEETPNEWRDISELTLDMKRHDFEMIEIYGLNDENMTSILSDDITEEQIEKLKSGKGCIIRNPIKFEGSNFEATEYSLGEEITINGNKLEVVDIMQHFGMSRTEGGVISNSIQIIIPYDKFVEVLGEKGYNQFSVKLNESVDKLKADELIESIVNADIGSYYISYEKMNDEYKESAKSITLLAWGLIIFIGIIGVLNIVNTVYTNIHTRVREIGVSRAIGMDKQGLYKMFLWEGAYYGIYASIIGSILGYLLTVLINYSISNELNLLNIPFLSMFFITIITISACLIATLIPLKTMGKINIMDAIAVIE